MEDVELTVEKAIEIAKEFGLENEVQWYIEHGYTPAEALQEWDL